ncbi:MAG: phosphotriesterase [Armatimonadota bacterium]
MLWLSWVFALFATPQQDIIMTVRGPIAAAEFGKALVHEHVMCDFIGADKTGRHRYDPEEIVKVMLPFLQAVKERGFSGFVDATPAYIGRDPSVLKRLSELTGLHVLTNTGYYGAANDKFVPPHAFYETADQLAARWISEWREGIDGTGIKPGFIKIGIDPGPLSEIDRKLVQAAARTHLQTGLTIACHTGEARAALEVLNIVKSEGVDPSALIVVHADAIPDEQIHEKLAMEGAWVEYDAIGARPINEHVKLISSMVRKGFVDRLLLSQDAGWYWVGEPDGGKDKIRPYTALMDELLPALKSVGIDETVLKKLLVDNPCKAFTIRVRKR